MSELALRPEDIELAQRRGLHFKVSWREKRGQRWLALRDDIPSLPEAFALARAAQVPNVSLWVKCLDRSGNLLYWGSDCPALFNSVVLQEGYS